MNKHLPSNDSADINVHAATVDTSLYRQLYNKWWLQLAVVLTWMLVFSIKDDSINLQNHLQLTLYRLQPPRKHKCNFMEWCWVQFIPKEGDVEQRFALHLLLLAVHIKNLRFMPKKLQIRAQFQKFVVKSFQARGQENTFCPSIWA